MIRAQAFGQWASYLGRRKKLIRIVQRIANQRSEFGLKDVFRAWRIEALRRGYKVFNYYVLAERWLV